MNSVTDAMTIIEEYPEYISITNYLKQTPLHLTDDSDIAQLLIQKGANVEALDYEEKTPLFYAAATRTDTSASVLRVLVKTANINAKDIYGRTALSYCVYYDAIDILVKKGSDLNTTDKTGKIHYIGKYITVQ